MNENDPPVKIKANKTRSGSDRGRVSAPRLGSRQKKRFGNAGTGPTARGLIPMRIIGTKHGHHSDASDRPMTKPPLVAQCEHDAR